MTTYKDAGVDIEAGGQASKKAYAHAVATFKSRKGLKGTPVEDEDGFAGLIDMGNFYLVQNADGTGSKMEVAYALRKFDTLGYDLLAMVADDAICTGAEVVSVSNTIDVASVDEEMVDELMAGLSKACQEQKIVIPGGEIAEVPGAVNSPVWNATSVGILEKGKELKPETIAEGDVVIALQSAGLRSNGFSLARKILADNVGESWHTESFGDTTWGEALLTPSVIYHGALLTLLGRFGEERKVDIKGITHITGGGIADNLGRALKKSDLGANLTDLYEPQDFYKELINLGGVEIAEAYRTWNMGNGMLVIVSPKDADATISGLSSAGIESKKAGEVTKDSGIKLTAFDGSSI